MIDPSAGVWGSAGTSGLRGGFPFPRLYALQVAGQIALHLVLILLLIEGIFLAEELMHVLERLFEFVGKQAWFSEIGLLLATRTPEVFDLALATAVLIAVYRVMLRSREERELLALAAMGVGTHQLIWLAVIIGIAAQLSSLFVTGFLEPHARYLQRSIYFDAAFRALRSGSAAGQFYLVPNHVVYVVPQSGVAQGPRLFIHQTALRDIDHVITASRARLAGPDRNGHVALFLSGVTVDEFDHSREPAIRSGSASAPQMSENNFACDNCRASRPARTLRFNDLVQQLALDDIMRFEPRGKSPTEWTTLELAGVGPPLSTTGEPHLIEVGSRIARSFLCLIAPFVGGLALSFTGRGNQAFALPLACAALMGFDVLASAAVKALAPMGLAMILLIVSAFAVALVALLMQQIVARQHAIIRPALVAP